MHASERARSSLPDLTDEAELEVNDERASILSAAANARSIAMLTGTHGVIAMPIDVPRLRLPTPQELVREGVALPASEGGEDETIQRIRAVAAARASAGDTVGELRARIDLAAAKRDAGDDAGARAELEAILERSPRSPVAHAMMRALRSGREDLDAQLAHVAELASLATSAAVRADWISERARLLEARDGASAESVAAWTEALSLAPEHAGALYGVETSLDATAQWSELAAALARLAELPGTAPEIAAWLQVERALLFDRRLADQAGARAALATALALVPGIGPVRDACVDHAVSQRDDARLAALLESEAAIEPDAARAARLELDAALAHLAAGREVPLVIALLERAHARPEATPLTARRVAVELARLYDAEGRHDAALRVRKSALRAVTDPREELVALRVLATSAERAGEIDEAVHALERARALLPDDGTLLAEVDRLLLSAKRHEQRAVLWMRESARVEDAEKKARALMTAAAASKAAGRDVDAGRYLQSAWVTAPAAPGVYDALCERLAPHADLEAASARIALYEQAARATPEPDKKILFLEKIAWLWDDVAGDAARAACAYEDVLLIEPARLSAITGLASAALRTGDMRALARAQKAEADITADLGVRAELRLRAAETLSTFDPDRSLALAEELREDARVASRAAELVTRLHSDAGRWDLAAKTLRQRADASEGDAKVALVLAEAAILVTRLRAPERALEALAAIRGTAGADPAVVAATLDALEALGDPDRLRVELEKLAEAATNPADRASLFLRAAELDERKEGRDEAALRAYERAREAMPAEPLAAERIRRLGARTRLGDGVGDVAPLAGAVRLLDANDETPSAEPLLASGARDVATLRMIERLARRARSAPQLANALALEADAFAGPMSRRALEGLASLVAWTLPPSEDAEPWERLVALGSTDVAVLDTLLHRARPAVRAGDVRIVELVTTATARRLSLASDDSERLALHLDLARLRRRAQALDLAVVECKQALAIDGGSFAAAALLAELAVELGDRAAGIVAARALAELAVSPSARASLLRDAADLAAASKDRASAAALLEQALDADPDAVDVAARLADLQAQLGAFRDLGRALQRALRTAKTAEAIVPMASELADVARNRLQDPMLAIEALERAREASPKHVPTLFVLAELYIGQRAWDRALAALADVVTATEERGEKLVALVGRASIYRRILDQIPLAERELRTALEIDPHDVRALRGLLELRVVGVEERAALLTRLVVTEQPPHERLSALLELAEARRSLGDAAGAEGALVEAAALSPDPAMLSRVRAAAGDDHEAAARVLSRAVARAREAGRALTPMWLIGLGELELELGRVDESIERFEEALELDSARDEARFALARAYAARGRHDTAAAALSPLLESPSRQRPLDIGFVRLLESSLAGAGRSQQAHVARELRAIGGDLDPAALAELEGRRSMYSAQADGMPASSLRSFVMPGGIGNHPIWDVAVLASSFAGKLARIGLAEQGVSTRDRIKPKAVHPLRQLFDRMMRAFELTDVELAASEHAVVPSIACEDVPWIIVPASLGDWPEPYAVAALARPFTRIALGVPWLGPIAAHEVLSLIVAFARQVAPSFSATPAERVEPLVDDFALRARRAIDRRRRRVLEELESVLDRAAPIDESTFGDAVMRTEARAAFLLSGSLRATLECLGAVDQELGAALRVADATTLGMILSRPVSRDAVAFALSPDATALRRSLGTLA